MQNIKYIWRSFFKNANNDDANIVGQLSITITLKFSALANWFAKRLRSHILIIDHLGFRHFLQITYFLTNYY